MVSEVFPVAASDQYAEKKLSTHTLHTAKHIVHHQALLVHGGGGGGSRVYKGVQHVTVTD